MKVAFFQPRHFNRTERNTNPFFDPIIDVCNESGISYRIFQPYRHPDAGYPVVYSSQYLRKFVRLVKWAFRPILKGRTEADLGRLAGRMWNALTLGAWRADVYVTVAYELYDVLHGINPKARIVDVQHGIICPGHWGYLDSECRVSDFLLALPEREVWVSGDGYRDLFLRDARFAPWVDEHVHVVGSPAVAARPHCAGWVRNEGRVLVSLQLSSELDKAGLEEYKDAVRGFLREYAAQGRPLGLVTLRHHPRYSNCIDISDMLREFKGIHLSSNPFPTIIQDTTIHVTVDSTTAFDAAAYGVPTYFIRNETIHSPVKWASDFNYPYTGWPFGRLEAEIRAHPDEVRRTMRSWFDEFYAGFKPLYVKQLLLGKVRQQRPGI